MSETDFLRWYAETVGSTRGFTDEQRVRIDMSRVIRGYRRTYVPLHPAADYRGFVPEHRLVMERRIGRFLRTEEQVHHRNGDGLDNRPENLRLFPSQSAHMRFHQRRRCYAHLSMLADRAGEPWHYFFTPELRQVLAPETLP